jgi:hypothetical protein
MVRRPWKAVVRYLSATVVLAARPRRDIHHGTSEIHPAEDHSPPSNLDMAANLPRMDFFDQHGYGNVLRGVLRPDTDTAEKGNHEQRGIHETKQDVHLQ